ncbi:hypothetical protein [Clostridium sp. MD294]|uniref:hypothetical protein n=1 Tax=Clostridium sp. MD294 TaxID=97138 RepID=UPI0002CC0E4C|nr:hypothetical protein [Clostridium sp. MD294]NDO45444.1 hypothetical protein [Clostridium sp. MD294]USF30909.1 hypothetical protein C820_002353 [Clostridium sp. MD294]
MKIARELNLNESLEELVQEKLDVLQNEKARVVFYKEEGKWQTNVIVLQEDNTVSERDLKTLKWIKSVDDKALVIEKRDFKKNWKDELVTLEEMVGTIEYKYNQMDCHNNIGKFLEKCEEMQKNQPTTLKFDKKEFLQSRLGGMLHSHMDILQYGNEYKPKYNIFEEITVIKAILAAIKQCYGVTYYIAFNQDKCGIFSPDTNDWLFE